MTPPFIQANTNGRLHPASEPSITPLSRGFLYGDAIYEVWRSYDGGLFAWEEHFVRLEASARSVHMELPFSRAMMFEEIRRTVAAFRTTTDFRGDVYVRLQVWRGAGPIGLDPALADRTEFVLIVQPCPVPSAEKLRAGLNLSVATALRRNPIESLSPAWKTGNALNAILGLREARSRGADEVIMLNLRGEVTEAAVANVAFVREGAIVTPPLEAGILSGITRQLVLGPVSAALGVTAKVEALTPADFQVMSECFLLSTTRDVMPVASLDGQKFRVGDGTVGARLKAAFVAYARDYVRQHPELAV
jgi:branched-subunit amino acid aminotransferase/4-amino-4-deoxychorismate lyase